MQKISLLTAQKIVAQHHKKERDIEDAKSLKICKSIQGTYWKYRNSYGSGDNWWLYLKVIGLDKESRGVRVLSIEKTSHNKIEIEEENKSSYNATNPMQGYTKITKKEWVKGTKTSLDKITKEFNK